MRIVRQNHHTCLPQGLRYLLRLESTRRIAVGAHEYKSQSMNRPCIGQLAVHRFSTIHHQRASRLLQSCLPTHSLASGIRNMIPNQTFATHDCVLETYNCITERYVPLPAPKLFSVCMFKSHIELLMAHGYPAILHKGKSNLNPTNSSALNPCRNRVTSLMTTMKRQQWSHLTTT